MCGVQVVGTLCAASLHIQVMPSRRCHWCGPLRADTRRQRLAVHVRRLLMEQTCWLPSFYSLTLFYCRFNGEGEEL